MEYQNIFSVYKIKKCHSQKILKKKKRKKKGENNAKLDGEEHRPEIH